MTRLLQIACVLLLSLSAAKAGGAVSEKAQRFFNRGTAAIESASGATDFREAAEEFRKAYEAAPEWPDPYYNAGIALEKAGDPAEAAKAFRLYLKAAPDAADAAKVRQKADKLEYLAEKQAKKQMQNTSKQGKQDALVNALDGSVYVDLTDLSTPLAGAFRISKGKLYCGNYMPPIHAHAHNTKAGYTTRPNALSGVIDENLEARNLCGDILCPDSDIITTVDASLSEDGQVLKWRHNCSTGRQVVYSRLQ